MKHSKRQRKFVNQMRAMGDTPWPARRFTYPPTFANAIGSTPRTLLGTCKRPVGSVRMPQKRLGRLRWKREVEVRCGGNVYLRRGSLGRRRVYCADCLDRKRARAKQARIERRLSRFGAAVQVPEERSKFKRFLHR